MVDYIFKAFEDMLPQLKWMDKETAQRALDKLTGITRKLAYPDFIVDPTQLDSYYAQVSIYRSRLLQRDVHVTFD